MLVIVCFDIVLFAAVNFVLSRTVGQHFTCDLVIFVSTWYRVTVNV